MQLMIAAVGHKMPGWIETGFSEYTKRMPPELRIVLKEIKPVERSGSKTAATAMALGAMTRRRVRRIPPLPTGRGSRKAGRHADQSRVSSRRQGYPSGG